MADFGAAYNKSIKGKEGGYANNPADRGGETFAGISRVKQPQWPGWARVDSHLQNFAHIAPFDVAKLNEALFADEKLMQLVRDFYQDRFWNRVQGDLVVSQVVAEELFDSGINCGVRNVVSWLQRGLNALNRRGKSWPNLVVDGSMGAETAKTLNRVLLTGNRDVMALLAILNGLQLNHYISLMEGDETQEDFARSWIDRVIFAKTA